MRIFASHSSLQALLYSRLNESYRQALPDMVPPSAPLEALAPGQLEEVIASVLSRSEQVGLKRALCKPERLDHNLDQLQDNVAACDE